MSDWAQFLPLLLLVVVFWLVIVRPARTRQRAFLKTQNELSPGHRVMLSSGIFGQIVSIGDDTLELQVAPGTVLTVNRQAVARVIPPETDASTETSTETSPED